VCPSITFQEIVEFIPKLLENLYYEALMHGNLTKLIRDYSLKVQKSIAKVQVLVFEGWVWILLTTDIVNL